jgi:hypothetical protein
VMIFNFSPSFGFQILQVFGYLSIVRYMVGFFLHNEAEFIMGH